MSRFRVKRAREAPRRVLLMCQADRHYHRAVIQGVVEYARSAGGWEVLLDESNDHASAGAIARDLGASGLLVQSDRRAIHEVLATCGLPVVQMFCDPPAPRVPVVVDDERGFARMGFEHLREAGVSHFAFYDHAGVSGRYRHFVAIAEQAGHAVHRWPVAPDADARERETRQRELERWAIDLPKPVGVFCFGDRWGRELAEACRRGGLEVPDEVAILGIGDDEVLCEMANPPLSSIDPGGDRIGHEAAARLDDVMAGRRPRDMRTVVRPLTVVRRQSSDLLAVKHPDAAAAVRYIREHAFDGITAVDVIHQATVSRKTLESAFHRAFGRSIYQEILRVRLDKAEELLLRTTLPLADVAARSGFQYASALSTVFKRKRGETPSSFRRSRSATVESR